MADRISPEIEAGVQAPERGRPLDLLSVTEDERNGARGTTQQEIAARFGVQVRQGTDNQLEYYFRAGGVDHSVALLPDTEAGRLQAKQELEQFTAGKIQELGRDYKVTFAEPGKEVGKVKVLFPDCTQGHGDTIKAVAPTLPALFAIEHALSHSQPSQLNEKGDGGVKIYFLDKQPFPPLTEGRPALGYFNPRDNDGHRSLYVTPEGAALPPTAADGSDKLGRNLSIVLTHELAHNGQTNLWGSIRKVPVDIARELGWTPGDIRNDEPLDWMLNDRGGHHFVHWQLDCKKPPAWYRSDAYANLLTAEGTPAQTDQEAQSIPGIELRDRLSVKPATHYFTAPVEELAESITSYRRSPESRAQLLRESPKLYEITRRLDNQEIDRAYGTDWIGRSRYLRLPNGSLAPNTWDNQNIVAQFESGR